MVIRTQNKKGIVSFNKDMYIFIRHININQNYDIVCCNDFIGERILGSYSSEEKAIKVLDLIMSQINTEHIFEMPQDEDFITNLKEK